MLSVCPLPHAYCFINTLDNKIYKIYSLSLTFFSFLPATHKDNKNLVIATSVKGKLLPGSVMVNILYGFALWKHINNCPTYVFQYCINRGGATA